MNFEDLFAKAMTSMSSGQKKLFDDCLYDALRKEIDSSLKDFMCDNLRSRTKKEILNYYTLKHEFRERYNRPDNIGIYPSGIIFFDHGNEMFSDYIESKYIEEEDDYELSLGVIDIGKADEVAKSRLLKWSKFIASENNVDEFTLDDIIVDCDLHTFKCDNTDFCTISGIMSFNRWLNDTVNVEWYDDSSEDPIKYKKFDIRVKPIIAFENGFNTAIHYGLLVDTGSQLVPVFEFDYMSGYAYEFIKSRGFTNSGYKNITGYTECSFNEDVQLLLDNCGVKHEKFGNSTFVKVISLDGGITELYFPKFEYTNTKYFICSYLVFNGYFIIDYGTSTEELYSQQLLTEYVDVYSIICKDKLNDYA